MSALLDALLEWWQALSPDTHIAVLVLLLAATFLFGLTYLYLLLRRPWL